ncbi:hypothetical protein GCM10020331_084460 [Ectobacillus funiculus]
MSDEEVRNYLSRNPLTKLTNNTITTEHGFMEEIVNVRGLGYAYDDSEHEEGVFCIGASITLNNKKIMVQSVLVCQKYRLTEEFHKQIIEAVQKNANLIS